MAIRKGDNVKMLTGKDRNKTGVVARVLTAREGQEGKRVIITGLNTAKRHQRARRTGQKGQIIARERSVAISSVQFVCPKCGKSTRLAIRLDAGKKYRICKKCGADV